MDSPIVAQLFRQLFRSHPACQSRRNLAALSLCIQAGWRSYHHQHYQHQHQHQRQRQREHQRRGMSSNRNNNDRGWRQTVTRGANAKFDESETNWQQRTEMFSLDMTDEYKSYPMVTADELRDRKERPRKVKMLMRDFIEGIFGVFLLFLVFSSHPPTSPLF